MPWPRQGSRFVSTNSTEQVIDVDVEKWSLVRQVEHPILSTERPRSSPGQLILSTPPMADGAELRTFAIVWQRVAPSPQVVQTLDDAPTQIRRRRSG